MIVKKKIQSTENIETYETGVEMNGKFARIIDHSSHYMVCILGVIRTDDSSTCIRQGLPDSIHNKLNSSGRNKKRREPRYLAIRFFLFPLSAIPSSIHPMPT